MQIEDLVSSGMVRRWSFVDGYPLCVEDAIAPDDSGAVASLQANAAIRSIMTCVEAFEQAERIVARGEPDEPRTSTVTDISGVETEVESPRWVEYDAAVAEIETAGAATKAFARWRKGEEVADNDNEELTEARDAAIAAFNTAKTAPLTVDPRPVPTFVTMFQGRTVLRGIPAPAGSGVATLFDAVDAYINANKTTKPSLYDAWNYSNGFDRNGEIIGAMAPAFGLTSVQLDALFRAAASIKG